MDKLRKRLRDLKDEKIEPLIHLSYDRLANGSRYPLRPKKIDPEVEKALKKLFQLEKGEK